MRVNTAAHPPLIYDFYGFPPALYDLRYPAPGAPDLAREVAGAFAEAGLDPVLDAQRGWDHGVWVPLRLLFPAADVPIVAVSLPAPRTPALLLAMGAALRPLRERGYCSSAAGASSTTCTACERTTARRRSPGPPPSAPGWTSGSWRSTGRA